MINKTQATELSVKEYVAAIEDSSRRDDCQKLLKILSKTSGHPAVMWGAGIVGFGVHKYPLSGNRIGEICAIGFSSRAANIALYGLLCEGQEHGLMQDLGNYKTGKGCLYIQKLEDISLPIFEALCQAAFKLRHCG